MIPKVHNMGADTIRLLYYLYGPGKREEHTDPHLVAAWDSLAPDPGRDPDATLRDLQRLLDQPVMALPTRRRPAQHVWHLSARAAPEDPILTDEQWAAIAHRLVAATGIAPTGDDAACRWAAVRHANDHIHIIATAIREDGRRARIRHDGARSQAEARKIEIDYGLRRLNAGDGTAAKRPTSAEIHKAQRRGKDRTAREELREAVRRAATGAAGEQEFFDRLAGAGLLVRRRIAPSGNALGYKVALADDRNKNQQPVFYPGSALAPDLSLPRLRERWTPFPDRDTDTELRSPRARRVSPATARRDAATAIWDALVIVDQGHDGKIAAQLSAAGEVLDALAKTSAAHTRRELGAAAAAFERASRSHIRAERGHDRALRQAARDLVRGGPALVRGEDGATTAMLIDMVFFLVTAAVHWHNKHQHAQQAAAAHQAAQHLRAAYRAAAPTHLTTMHRRGQLLPRARQQKHAAQLRQALPAYSERILAEPGWFALAATITEVEKAGHDPAELLVHAVGQRELATAESVSDVLTWRLRRIADLPADVSAPPRRRPPRTPPGRAAGPTPQPTSAPPRTSG
ncbi:relaxase/mobilization nuclease domain-containing protein [Actinacidiphila sp. bgisy144]|uniref:relaxase/mobilization nuclease domain-containing protein n=1 Tax=Actinacidiphila sp. bgisy144 TaxID=3413791 RepID=UPI003EB8A913